MAKCVSVALERCQTVCQLCRLGSWLVVLMGRELWVWVWVYKVQTLFPACFKVALCFRRLMGTRPQGQTDGPVLEKTQHNLTFIQRPNPTVYRSGSFHKQPSQVEGSHNLCVCKCVWVCAWPNSLTHSSGRHVKAGQSSSKSVHKQTQGKDTHTHITQIKPCCTFAGTKAYFVYIQLTGPLCFYISHIHNWITIMRSVQYKMR